MVYRRISDDLKERALRLSCQETRYPVRDDRYVCPWKPLAHGLTDRCVSSVILTLWEAITPILRITQQRNSSDIDTETIMHRFQ